MVGEITDFSRARRREEGNTRVENRIFENVRAIRRRWKSKEKSKGHARSRISEEMRRYRESQTRVRGGQGEDGRGLEGSDDVRA